MTFNHTIQEIATKAGLLQALLTVALSEGELEHVDHNFNFDVDSAYDSVAGCYEALTRMAKDNVANQKEIVSAHVPESIEAKWSTLTARAKTGACDLLRELKVKISECQ